MMLKRVVLFLLTNLAVLVLLGLVLRALDASGIFPVQSLPLSPTTLLAYAAILGFGGSFRSSP